MQSEHITQEEADEYALGALAPAEAQAIALHTLECDPCLATVQEAERVAASLTLGVPLHRPPADLRNRVFETAGIRRPGPVRRAFRFSRMAAGFAAVIVAVAAFTGMLSVRDQIADLRKANTKLEAQVNAALGQQVEIAALTRAVSQEERKSFELSQALGADRELLLAMLSPESSVADVYPVDQQTSALGRLVWDEQQKRVWFVATRLPQRPEGETYQIWVHSAGRYVSLGTFNADANGFARYETLLPQGLTNYDTAVVTIERSPGANQRASGTVTVFVAELSRLRK